MKDEDTINVGDTVRVDFNGAQTTLFHMGEVLYKPGAVGESWVFKYHSVDRVQKGPTKHIYYVSEGCTVTKISAEEVKP